MGLLEILIRDFGLKREKKKGKPKKKPAQWMGLSCYYVEKSIGQAFEEAAHKMEEYQKYVLPEVIKQEYPVTFKDPFTGKEGK